jgi:predicted acyltransferase
MVMTAQSSTLPSDGQYAMPHNRLVSLDVLRGLTVALMILVNNAGDGAVSYAQLRHSIWNGCTLTDIVFPTFLFIVGGSIAMALPSRISRGFSHRSILLHVFERSVLIFFIGLAINALPWFHLADLRIYGVLQRIALCYLLAATIFLTGGVRACLVIVVALLVGYWWLLMHVPVPGFGRPGIDVPLLDMAGNMTSWLDRLMVPANHLYRHTVYDPEGLLSTLPALASTLLGVISVRWLRGAHPFWQRAYGLLICGLLLLAGGLLWANTFPLNKRLWTSSFVLFTTGIAMVLLALLFWLIDGPGRLKRGLEPWLALGSNALTAYVLSEVLAIALAAIPIPMRHVKNLQRFLFALLPRSFAPPPFVSLVYSILFVAVCFLPVWVMYRRRIFLKL